MDHPDTSLLKHIWVKNIVGKVGSTQNKEIIEFLYYSYISRNDEILTSLNITIPDSKGLTFLYDLVNSFAKVTTNPLGFFPIGILKSSRLTCAGAAMLTNTILKNKGYDVKYARPVSHSVNIVKLENKNYWVDSANTVMVEINIEIKEKEGFSIGYFNSNNKKVNYKLAPLLKSEDIIINVFGNMEALKLGKGSDKLADGYLSQNPEIFQIDFNSYLNGFYKEYFDYIRFDREFNAEQTRVKRWLSEE